MNHESWRERMALELYGELDSAEAAALAEHLAECEPCREFRASLRAGLGWLTPNATELDGALERLHADFSSFSPRPASSPWLAIAAALLVGLGLGFGLSRTTLSTSRPTSSDSATMQPERSTPPPPARAGGELAQLAHCRATR